MIGSFFRGMEEVVSSNLTRSTKFLKDLQKQSAPNAFFGVRMESRNGRQRRSHVPIEFDAPISGGSLLLIKPDKPDKSHVIR